MSAFAKMMAMAGFLGGGKGGSGSGGSGGGMEQIAYLEVTEEVASVTIPIDEAGWEKVKKAHIISIDYFIPNVLTTAETAVQSKITFSVHWQNDTWNKINYKPNKNLLSNSDMNHDSRGMARFELPGLVANKMMAFVQVAGFAYGAGVFSESGQTEGADFMRQGTYGTVKVTPDNTAVTIHAGSKFAVYVA